MGDRKGDRVRGRIEEQNVMRGGGREREPEGESGGGNRDGGDKRVR